MSSFYRSFLFFTFLLFCKSLNAQIEMQKTAPEEEIENISLKLNLDQGGQYRFINTSTQEIIIELAENPMQTTTEKTIHYLLEILSNTNEGLKIKATCERVAILIQLSGNDPFKIDTDLPENEQNSDLYPMYSSFINQPFYLFVNREGELQKTERLTDVSTRDETKDALLSKDSVMLASLFSDLENTFYIFPKDSVSMGKTWATFQNNRIDHEINIDIKKSFTLESLSEDLAWINIDHQITNSPSSMGLTLTGTQEGTIEVEKKSGLILYSDAQQEIVGEINIAEFMVPLKISSSTKTTGEKL